MITHVHETYQPSPDLNSDCPAYKRLISGNFSQTELISLLEATFTSQDEARVIDDLCGDDAQAFIDVVDEVRLALICLLALV